MAVALDAGNGEAAEVCLGESLLAGEGIREDAELLEEVAADIDALVAGDAAIVLEKFVALFLVWGDGVVLAAKIAVEACSRA